MDRSSPAVGCPFLDALSPAQRAVYADVPFKTTPVTFDALSTDDHDLLWWHQEEPLAITDELYAHRERLLPYLREGGGLLLTGRALSAVAALGVDPVPPDVTGVDEEPTGPLPKARYTDHPLFSGFDERAFTAEHAPFARYEGILPERGEPLAATARGSGDAYGQLPIVVWRVGRGAVLGIGSFVSVGDAFSERRDLLLSNAIDCLARPEELPERPQDVPALGELRATLAGDHHRPSYHLTAPANWLNDPNGLIRWNGQYHVFYQYNPGGPHHGTIHWGHASSTDLVRWRDEPVALTPSPNGPDRDGCWSGCAVDDDGTPTLVYTGGRERRQLPCLATSDDPELRTWEKYEANPVIGLPPEEPPLLSTDHWETEFRDHALWREEGIWHHLIGSGTDAGIGVVLHYTGTDLDSWQYQGPILAGEPGEGHMWECPELLGFADRDLLHVSNYDEVRYFIGSFDAERGRFDRESTGLLDHGDFYAPQSLADGDRYLTWGWLPEARGAREQWEAGWSGCLSLPRELSVEGGELRQRPAPELEGLRGERHEFDLAVEPGTETELPIRGRSLELTVDIDLGDAESIEIACFASPDGDERATIRYTGEELLIDRSRVGGPGTVEEPVVAPAEDLTDPLTLRAFVDCSVVELFANERRCLTGRVYPEREDGDRLSVSAEGGSAHVSMAVWPLDSIW
ncbi:glycoside hydrolase family 32 protein [Natronorarus salvus]|uniref:glycoside hydrolase family 32 protein n=1 Tax=Natronorarus salvus TaxID=3117733 RepID=UPI002F26B315